MAETRHRSTINNSPSKAQYAFPKASRFVTPKPNTTAFGYEIVGGFKDQKKQGQGRGFSTSEDRFGYDMKRKVKRDAGPINGPTDCPIEKTKNRTFSYSFGVSRMNMKKIHVDEILKKKEENLPGPDRYEKKGLFGPGLGSSYSMRKKITDVENRLEKSAKLPGPGHYEQGGLVGGGLSSSMMRSAQASAFPKAQDRFRPPKMQSPPSTHYQVKDNITNNFNASYSYAGHTKFGKNTRSYIDEQWYLKKSGVEPGPGAYQTFSDFSGAF